MSKQKPSGKKGQRKGNDSTRKVDATAMHREDSSGEYLTTNQGVRINDNQNTLKDGERGASLLEDFIFREKMTHFDHERIPERIVHARGSGAHGYFQVYEPMTRYTKAKFLQDPSVKTPVFVRFSTVAGFRGSTDLARDVRGFAVKFYTEEGNFDLVGNNIPVFFIQDAMKFPDVVHAVKPEPHNEIPQAASAHDTFWDFISLMPESAHMIMWVMSDRAIPRSYRMMEGFGVHTFRFINDKGKACFVKFHWKPLLGLHAVAWDEAQNISGKDPDFHRQDLWEAIENGQYPEWEFGVQIVEEKDEHAFGFDLLDPTKIIPEELVPVRRIGKLTLNRNPDNFFAETEQVAFHPGHIVPGIDFTNDPLLQGRLFSYTDTQLIRLGGPNFHEIPINRPLAPVHNNQRDGYMRQTINKGRAAYDPNTLGGGCPFQAAFTEGGFATYAERIDGRKIRARSESFFDHFSQAALFYRSQSEPEQNHMVNALRFELGKVETPAVQERMLYVLSKIDKTLARRVADGLGVPVPARIDGPLNMSIPADGDPKRFQPKKADGDTSVSPALSMLNNPGNSIATRKVAILAADGADRKGIEGMKKALMKEGAAGLVVGPRGGVLRGSDGGEIMVDVSLLTTSSVLFDAVYVPGGEESIATLRRHADMAHFINEAYKHCKPIAGTGAGVDFLRDTYVGADEVDGAKLDAPEIAAEGGIVAGGDRQAAKVAAEFVRAIGMGRFWEREKRIYAPA